MSFTVRNNQVGGTYDSNHIYYNVSIVNNDVTGAKPPPPIIFNEIRNAPYLANPQDYFMSVVRFSLDSSTLPIFIPQAQQGQTNINLTIYSVTLEQTVGPTTYTQQTFVIFVPQNPNEPLPSPPVDFVDLRNSYYFVYSFEAFCDMVNTAFATCLTALNAQITAGGGTPTTTLPPFLSWQAGSFLATLNTPVLTSSFPYDYKNASGIRIYMNAPLYNLFSSFKAKNLSSSTGSSVITNGKNFQLLITNENGQNIIPKNSGSPAPFWAYPNDILYMTEEYETTPLWNPVQSIVFTTGFLPVVPELTAVPVVFGADTQYFNAGNNSNITNTLTDFEVGLTTGADYKPLIQYTPSGEYRLVDLFGNNPISSIEIRIFWKDAYGNLYPFLLGPDCNCSIKIMFRKKTLYNNDL